jgi:MFS family permease
MRSSVESSLKKGVQEGGVSAISSSLTETYIPLFALTLRASPSYIGWLTGIPSALSPLAQLLGDKLMARYTRKQIVTVTRYIEAAFFLPIAGLGWFIHVDYIQAHALTLLIILYTLLMSIAAVHAPAWFSWMGDLIPEKQRGAYFSKRYTSMGWASMGIILGGLALDYYQTQGLALATFGILFTFAALTRIYSARLLSAQYEPRIKKKENPLPYSLWHFLKHNTATRRFVIYVGLYNLVMYIASPFFPVYMDQNLGFSYTWITLISLASSLFYIVAMPYIGTFSDKYGNLRLFYFASLLYALNPLAWLLFPNPWILLALQLIGGLANAAYAIGVTNYLLNTVPSTERAIVTTYTNILVGVGIFLGSALGGYAMTYHPSWINAVTYTFLISSFGRFVITLLGIKHMHERERVHPVPQGTKVNILHPLRSLYAEMHFIKHLKR